jgi:RNA ligase (TIGR02306 family)
MENNNSVCFVSEITEMKGIVGADNIELAVVGGWNCIVKKGVHFLGERVVCATTDAIIPEKLSDELGVTNYLRNGGRVRTVKLRGVYSECLIIPKHKLADPAKYSLGDDVMDALKIYKYEPPVKMVQLASGRKIRYQDNPHFHVYYKFPNLKNVPDMFNENDTVEITRKIHGTNARYGIVKKNKLSIWDKIRKFVGLTDKWIDYEFVVGSHNVEKGSDSNGFYDTNVWYEIADKYKVKERLWEWVKLSQLNDIGDGFVVYGEIYGAGIQKGYDYGLNEIKFAGFDIKLNGEYLDTFRAEAIINWLELSYVPVLYRGRWYQEIQDSFVFNNFIPGTKVPEEGIVIKYHTGERQKVAKVINPDYLIYAEKHNVEDSH